MIVKYMLNKGLNQDLVSVVLYSCELRGFMRALGRRVKSFKWR